MIIIENRIGSGSSYIHAKHARSKSARAATGFRLPPALRIRALPFKQWVRGSNPRRVTKRPDAHLGIWSFAVGDSKNQMGQSSGLTLTGGSTPVTPYAVHRTAVTNLLRVTKTLKTLGLSGLFVSSRTITRLTAETSIFKKGSGSELWQKRDCKWIRKVGEKGRHCIAGLPQTDVGKRLQYPAKYDIISKKHTGGSEYAGSANHNGYDRENPN